VKHPYSLSLLFTWVFHSDFFSLFIVSFICWNSSFIYDGCSTSPTWNGFNWSSPSHDHAFICTSCGCRAPANQSTFGSAYDAAIDATNDAASNAAHDAEYDAARYATHDATRHAAHDAALDAAHDAAHDAAYDATHGAANNIIKSSITYARRRVSCWFTFNGNQYAKSNWNDFTSFG
jgi:hypothetical protein